MNCVYSGCNNKAVYLVKNSHNTMPMCEKCIPESHLVNRKFVEGIRPAGKFKILHTYTKLS